MTTVYGTDLDSYLHFTPNSNMVAIALAGGLDPKPTNAEEKLDNMYDSFTRIHADDIISDITELYPNTQQLTMEQANQIIDAIEQAKTNNQDIVVHCYAGVSRTGAVIQLCYKLMKIKCENLICTDTWMKRTPITDSTFPEEYVPNSDWLDKLTRALENRKFS